MLYRKSFWVGVAGLLFAATLGVTLATPVPAAPGTPCDADNSCAPLVAASNDGVPGSVLADAQALATEWYGAGTAQTDEMARQLIATYQALRDKDVAIVFNPGGWGWDPISEIPGWETILAGLKDTLEAQGYRTMLIDYKRTAHGFNGMRSETMELLRVTKNKAAELAARMDFLTSHLPNLSIILSGESNGAAVAEDAMQMLRDNPRVYAIETGPPCWHPSHPLPRALVIDNNGIEQDAFTSGDWIRSTRANLEAIFGLYPSSRGNVLLYIGAPGHVYFWEYDAVRTQMCDFLAEHFPAK